MESWNDFCMLFIVLIQVLSIYLPPPKWEENMATDSFDSNELFNIYLQKMGSIPLLSREDEIEVARRIAEQGNDAEIAKQTLITANLRLVVSIAKQYSYRGMP